MMFGKPSFLNRQYKCNSKEDNTGNFNRARDIEGKYIRYIYWLEPSAFIRTKIVLKERGINLIQTKQNFCEALRASGKNSYYIPIELWQKRCVRQGSWYRDSQKKGKFLLVSGTKLSGELDSFLDAIVRESSFNPKRMPDKYELETMMQSDCYLDNKPEKWEQVRFYEKILFKFFLTLTGFWQWNESWDERWLTHRANHANFLCKKFTTEIDGIETAYSISDSAGICSSCMEIFNIISPHSKKLVRGCPGSILMGCLKKDQYYDITPVRLYPAAKNKP